jgi:carboxyl-terminal processing protease
MPSHRVGFALRFTILCTALTLGILAASVSAQSPAVDFDSTLQSKSAALSSLWQQKDYAPAVVILEEILALPGLDEEPWYISSTWYNLACGYALLGRTDDALSALAHAGEAGFGDWQAVQNDPDLSSLRGDPRFDRVLARIKAGAVVWQSPALATAYRESLLESERVAGLSTIWSEVKYNSAYPEKLVEANWDSLYMAFIPRVQEATGTEQYYRVLEEFAARLHDGHTSVDVPNELFSTMYARPELDTRMLDGAVAVVAVLCDTLGDLGIHSGLEVVSVDGLPVREYAERFVAPFESASTPQSAEASTYGLYLLCGSPAEPARVEFRDESGVTFERSLARTRYRILSYDENVQFRMLDDSVAYVALNSFGGDGVVAAFDSVFGKIGEARGLILDLRQNTGGNSQVGWDILAYLADKPFETGVWQTRTYEPTVRAWGMATRWHTTAGPTCEPLGTKHYGGPVVVLCGALTGSAAEDFLMAFDAMGRGTIIGEPTAGSSGQPIWFPLPGGGTGRVCASRTTYPDGTEYVGRGIAPDVVVHPTLAGVRQDRDPVLEAAVEALRR